MPFIIVRHKVKDFDQWRKVFSQPSHQKARTKAGGKGGWVLRSAEDPNEVWAVWEVESLDKARKTMAAEVPKLGNVAEQAGLAGPPEVYYLDGKKFKA